MFFMNEYYHSLTGYVCIIMEDMILLILNKERSIAHKVTEEEYRENMSDFLGLLANINEYDEIVLWFGDEPFCRCNRDIVVKTLNQHNYNGNVLLHIGDEETGEVLQTSDMSGP